MFLKRSSPGWVKALAGYPRDKENVTKKSGTTCPYIPCTMWTIGLAIPGQMLWKQMANGGKVWNPGERKHFKERETKVQILTWLFSFEPVI